MGVLHSGSLGLMCVPGREIMNCGQPTSGAAHNQTAEICFLC
jgi:hypothetical protein